MAEGAGTGLGRIIAAYELAAVRLRGFEALSAELLRPDTELALCVVLAVFAGIGLPTLGPVADSIRSLKPSLNLAAAGKQLDSAVRAAAAATKEGDLVGAAAALAQAMQDLGPEKVGPLIGSSQFSALRSYLAPMRGNLLGVFSAEASIAGNEPSPLARSGNLSAAWWGLGLVAGLGVALVVVGSAPKRKMNYGYG